MIEKIVQLVRNKVNNDLFSFVELFAGSGNVTKSLLSSFPQISYCELIEIDEARIRELANDFDRYEKVRLRKVDAYRYGKKLNPNLIYFADPPYVKDQTNQTNIKATPQYNLINQAVLNDWQSGLFIMQAPAFFCEYVKKENQSVATYISGNNGLILTL